MQAVGICHDPLAKRKPYANDDEHEGREEVHVARAHGVLVLAPVRMFRDAFMWGQDGKYRSPSLGLQVEHGKICVRTILSYVEGCRQCT